MIHDNSLFLLGPTCLLLLTGLMPLGSYYLQGDSLIVTLSLVLLAITQSLEHKINSWQPTITRTFLEWRAYIHPNIRTHIRNIS